MSTEPTPGTWAHTVQVIRDMPIDEFRARLEAARARHETEAGGDVD